MEVRVTPAIEQIIPPQISFNFEEIRAELAQKLQVYQNMVVTESGVKEAKVDRANLNKFKAALADSRKSVKSQWNQPISDFEDKMKVLEQMVDEPISVIDRQIKSFEEIKKEEKRQSIEAFFEDNVGDLEEILPLQKIWNDRWVNATYPMKEIEQEIISIMRKTHNDIGIIVAMQLPCTEQMLSTYLDTLDMSKAMEEKHRYEQAQKAKEQIVKPNQEETVPQSKPVVVEKKEQSSDSIAMQQVGSIPENKQMEQTGEAAYNLKVLDFRVWVTPEQMQALKAFLLQNHIRYGRVE